MSEAFTVEVRRSDGSVHVEEFAAGYERAAVQYLAGVLGTRLPANLELLENVFDLDRALTEKPERIVSELVRLCRTIRRWKLRRDLAIDKESPEGRKVLDEDSHIDRLLSRGPRDHHRAGPFWMRSALRKALGIDEDDDEVESEDPERELDEAVATATTLKSYETLLGKLKERRDAARDARVAVGPASKEQILEVILAQHDYEYLSQVLRWAPRHAEEASP